jgi:lincosamide and streptogramin A transport system ATP-binding/permease protein
LVGRNGCGKSTLLDILQGKYTATVTSGVLFSCFPCNIVGETGLDIIENVSGAEQWRILAEVSKLALDAEALYKPLDTLSGGERAKAMLAALFLDCELNGKFPLIDEPTTHLDTVGRVAVTKYLSRKDGFILVSHDRVLLNSVCDHTVAINNADIEVIQGNYNVWRENFLRKEQYEQTQNERLKQDIARLETSAREISARSENIEKHKRGVNSAGLKNDTGFMGHKAAKVMQLSKNAMKRAEGAIAEKSELLKNAYKTAVLKIYPLVYRSEKLFDLRVNDVTYPILRGGKYALSGGNGSGKSTIMKSVCGIEVDYAPPVPFVLDIPKDITVSYVPQNINEITDITGVDDNLFRAILAMLGVPSKDLKKISANTDTDNFSSGQRKKLAIAASLASPSHLYVWDEPLNYIDVISAEQIEQLCRHPDMTLLFAEHDTMFAENIGAEKIEIV